MNTTLYNLLDRFLKDNPTPPTNPSEILRLHSIARYAYLQIERDRLLEELDHIEHQEEMEWNGRKETQSQGEDNEEV
tara:strand:+ start:302 stop:532 length:231 start_codon:yes stop_codon:yes gene_type:complete